MTIPARHVRRAEPTQTLVFNYDVFENFVQSRADVDVAVGEGRAIVQHKLLRARALGLDALIESSPGPVAKSLRFPADQVSLHREIDLRQV